LLIRLRRVIISRMSDTQTAVLCPGQGAQHVGMGRAWADASVAAAAVFAEADAILGDALGAPLSQLCFQGPEARLNDTDVSQPAIYTCSVACWHGLLEREGQIELDAAAGLSLGEYTALHLAGVFDFATGLGIVAKRGRLMQEAAQASPGSMVALIGADEAAADKICDAAAAGQVLVPANYNAPGQIVLSGHVEACERALEVAQEQGFKATSLAVAGAFHSPLMQSAAEGLEAALADLAPDSARIPVWSNVTAEPHEPGDAELLCRRLVEQIVNPVRWSQICQGMTSMDTMAFREVAPGKVLRGLMRRINRQAKVTSHDQP
jgi:[acyl-carrier-protein] S-malonyltransferase